MRNLWIVVALCLLLSGAIGSAQMQRIVANEKGGSVDTPHPHPLSWWTVDPLRLDTTGDLMIGYPADNGVKLTASSYQVRESVKVLGVVNGSRIVQIIDRIQGKPGIHLYGSDLSAGLAQWMSLLVRPPGATEYSEILQFQTSVGLFQPFHDAELYGTGADTILSFYDPDRGNGGGCEADYWWFDSTGAHPVDFKPLEAAMHKAVGSQSVVIFYRCYAMHPATSQVDAPVQSAAAKCAACGFNGQVKAVYALRHGVAEPVKVAFVPSAPRQ